MSPLPPPSMGERGWLLSLSAREGISAFGARGQVSPLAVCAARLCFSAGRAAQAASFRTADFGPKGRWLFVTITGENRIRAQALSDAITLPIFRKNRLKI